MWKHYCPCERGEVFVGHGEPCNWCDAEESEDLTEEDTDGTSD